TCTGGVGGSNGSPDLTTPSLSTTAPCQPGWRRDTHHCHSGPPGVNRSTTTTSSTTTRSASTSWTGTSSTGTSSTGTSSTSTSSPTTPRVPCKAGWGYGDTNHCHSGRAGQQRAREEQQTSQSQQPLTSHP